MDNAVSSQQTAAEAYLTRLAERGIDYVFANAGTDFAPIVEALSHSPGSNRALSEVHDRAARERRHGAWRTAITASPASRRW